MRWDEDISAALQMEEMERPLDAESRHLAPIPENMPVPFGLAAGQPAENAVPPPPDWLDLVIDKRQLRGRGSHPGPQRDPATLTSPKAPSILRGGRLSHGVDRWHNPDGTVRSRLKERLEAEKAKMDASSAPQQPTTPASNEPPLVTSDVPDQRSVEEQEPVPFSVVGTGEHAGEKTLVVETFYGQSFQVRCGG